MSSKLRCEDVYADAVFELVWMSSIQKKQKNILTLARMRGRRDYHIEDGIRLRQQVLCRRVSITHIQPAVHRLPRTLLHWLYDTPRHPHIDTFATLHFKKLHFKTKFQTHVAAYTFAHILSIRLVYDARDFNTLIRYGGSCRRGRSSVPRCGLDGAGTLRGWLDCHYLAFSDKEHWTDNDSEFAQRCLSLKRSV